MKKRKIFLGIALAAAALVSLSSCTLFDQKESKTKPTTTEVTPTTTGVTPTTTQVTPTTTGVTPTTTQITPTTTTTVVEKFTVEFIGPDGKTAISALTKEVEEGATVTAPTADEAAQQGYAFVGWYTTKNYTKLFDFSKEIEADTKIYGKYEETIAIYEELKADAGNIFAYDFANTTATTEINSLPGFTENHDGTGTAAFAGGKLVMTSAAKEGDQKNDGHVRYNFDTPVTSGLIKGCFTLSTSITNSINFFRFYSQDTKTKYELGAAPQLRMNGTADPNTTLEAGVEFLFYFELDMTNKLLTVTVDGKETGIKNAPVALTDLGMLDFGSSKGAVAEVIVDNFALVSDSSVATLKQLATTRVNTIYATYNEADYTSENFATITSAKTTALANIEAATTEEAIQNAITTFDSAAKAVVTILGQAKIDAKAEIAALTQAGFETEVAEIIEKYNKEGGLIDLATSVEAVAEQVTAAKKEVSDLVKAEYDVTIKYYTTEGEVENSETSIKVVDGDSVALTDIPALTGYNIRGLYTDASFAVEYTEAITAATTIYVKVEVIQTKAISAYEGFNYADGAYAGDTWVVVSNSGNQKVSPTVGGNKDSSDAVTVTKLGKDDSLKSVAFDAAKKIELEMLSASTGTSNAVNVTVNLYAADGTTVVKTVTWESVTSGKVTTKANITIESEDAFCYVEVVFKDAKGDTSKNYGVYSITGTITLA